MKPNQSTISLYKLTLTLSVLFLLVMNVNIFFPLHLGYSIDSLYISEVASESTNVHAAVTTTPTGTAMITTLPTPAPSSLPEVTPGVTIPVGTPVPPVTNKYTGGKFLLIGDSLMLTGFGPELESSLLSYQDINVVRLGKYSTGLNRIDYYDWFGATKDAINKYSPDYLFVMFGANDGQGIRDANGKAYALYSSGWPDIYAKRVNDFVAQSTDKVKKIYWIGQPIPANNDFLHKFTVMNPIYQAECEKFKNCTFIDMWPRFAVDGKYTPMVADKNGKVGTVKTSDGVHVTQHGGRIMVEEILKVMNNDFELTSK